MKEEKEVISRDALLRALKEGVLRIIASPNDGCVAASIGNYWFYFESESQELSVEDYLKSVPENRIVEDVHEAIHDLEDDELNYYKYFIEESLAHQKGENYDNSNDN
ncbi:hypothetical protein M2146_002562 [Lachnospiraceae bacterium PF1-22]